MVQNSNLALRSGWLEVQVKGVICGYPDVRASGKGSTEEVMKKSRLVAGALVVALSAGSYGIAEASTKKISTKVSTSTTHAGFNAMGIGGVNGIKTVLDGLVTKNTITAAQETAILAALDAAHPANVGPNKAGAPLGVNHADVLQLVATTLGTDTATVKTQLKAGKTIADIAGAKTQSVIDAIVAAETKAIDAAVTAGVLATANATTLKAGLVAKVTAEVSQVHPGGFGPAGMGGGRGHGGNDGKHGGMGGMVGGTPPTLGSTGSSTNG